MRRTEDQGRIAGRSTSLALAGGTSKRRGMRVSLLAACALALCSTAGLPRSPATQDPRPVSEGAPNPPSDDSPTRSSATPNSESATEDWARVGPDLALEFPRDHGAHPGHRIEWWYLTGNLEGADGRRFGYQFTIFRQGLAPGRPADGRSPLRARQMLAGHFALTDVAGGRTLFAERLRRVGGGLASMRDDDLGLVLEDWSLERGEGDRLRLVASEGVALGLDEESAERRTSAEARGGFALELELEPTQPLVLHGDGGYSRKGSEAGNASAYVSWTRLATRGRLRLDGESYDLTGSSWFDHEFGSSVLEAGVVGWDWFGLQLDDGRELMLFELRRDDGAAPRRDGTWIEGEGRARALAPGSFELRATQHWTSPLDGARYPAAWRLEFPADGLVLLVTPLVADCELHTHGSTGVRYWEGPVDVRSAPESRVQVSGRGYAELTGYAGSMEGRF